MIQAFLAAEDNGFYSHPGVDYKGLIRASIQLLLTGKKKQGGSTITMQVTRNFLLNRDKTYKRKIKEIILALKIEKKFSKNEILELYLNKIYLGHRSYGIAATASTYYNKELDQLNLAQIAMIAGLPKAPSANNPITNPARAIERRNYVLRRMHELNYIDDSNYKIAVNSEISASLNNKTIKPSAPYVTEMVRQSMIEQFGDSALTSGLKVYTTIRFDLQTHATQAVRNGLYDYDERHGYHSSPHKNNHSPDKSEFIQIADIETAHVMAFDEDTTIAQLYNNQLIEIPFSNVKWARSFKTRNRKGPELTKPSDRLKVNDLILVRKKQDQSWSLAQLPQAEAALIAINANNGAILALSGGFDFFQNKYNRVTQSKRQPGSGFKPIIYTTALEQGYTTASLINDAPIVVDDPGEENEWRPENYSKKFFGMTPLRTALRKSRNLISIRLLRDLGIDTVTKTALRFGLNKDQLPQKLSLALGSGHATPLDMAAVYAVFANGGFKVEPYFIDRVEDYSGNILFQAQPLQACPLCTKIQLTQTDYAPKIITDEVNFLMNSMLRDVVNRGTATKAKVLGRNDLAGKTGTTNQQRDAWFNGFSGKIVATAWLGFDNATPLGKYETGGKAALPIWIDFMKKALKDQPEHTLIQPDGIRKAFIDPETGLLSGNNNGIWEYFRTENIPVDYAPVMIEEENPDIGTIEEEPLF